MEGLNTKREPAASELLNFAAKLADRADTLASRIQTQLAPVMQPSAPAGIEKVAAVKSYPPLFDEMRGKFYVIERSLNSIEDAMSRTEI